MSRSPARYQPETNPVQPIFLTTDPTGCRHARLPIGTLMQYADCMLQQANLPRNLAGTRQLIRSHPGNQCLCPPHLDRCAAAYREGYVGNEYGGLRVRIYVKALCPSMFSDLRRADNSRPLRHALYASWF